MVIQGGEDPTVGASGYSVQSRGSPECERGGVYTMQAASEWGVRERWGSAAARAAGEHARARPRAALLAARRRRGGRRARAHAADAVVVVRAGVEVVRGVLVRVRRGDGGEAAQALLAGRPR